MNCYVRITALVYELFSSFQTTIALPENRRKAGVLRFSPLACPIGGHPPTQTIMKRIIPMKRHLRYVRAIFAALALLSLSYPISAQEVTGVITGTVKDANGSVIPGATVTISDADKKVVVRTVNTNDDGEFVAPNLLSSFYDITVEAPSFKKSLLTRVKLDVGQRRSADVVMEAGNISESVLVTTSQVSVELTAATTSTVINGDQVRQLSINNRNFVQLVTLAPGVTNDLDDLVFTGTNNPDTQVVNRTLISVNGARSTQNTFTVDGADVTDRGSNLTIQ